MKAPAFTYLSPSSLEEALALRAEHADDSAVLAGGQSLVPLLNLRMAYPGVVIDLGRVGGLAGIRPWNDGLAIGAMTRHRDAELAGDVRERAPLVAQALPYVGHVAIRNRGTVGGSMAHADAAAELPAVALALDAELVARSVRGERVIPAADFFTGFMTTALAADELLVEIRLPAQPAPARSAFVEFARRHGDFALAGAAVVVARTATGEIADVRIAFMGAHSRPVRAQEAEAALRGCRPDVAMLREVAESAAAPLSPPAGAHGTSEYRRRVAAVVLRRALERATSPEVGR